MLRSLKDQWSTIKGTLRKCCEKFLGYCDSRKKEWISANTWDKILHRKSIKEKLNAVKEQNNKEALAYKYFLCESDIKRSIKRDKRVRAASTAQRAERAAYAGNTRELYRAGRELCNKPPTTRPVVDKAGKLLTTLKDQLQRWHEHFNEVFNTLDVETEADDDGDSGSDVLDIKVDHPNLAEISRAIKSLKCGKAPGNECIPIEALKTNADVTAEILLPLMTAVWKTGQVPDSWKEGIIIKLPKKGDLSQCSNWRGINLLPVCAKILCKVLLDRMTSAVDCTLRDEQSGFRAGRSCIDHFNVLRMILQQCNEMRKELYTLFIDFEKAFDRVRWTSIWRILKRREEVSPEVTENTENTVSSASLCMSPVADRGEAPLCTSTPYVPRPLTNGHDAVDNSHDAVDNSHADVVNGNVNVNIVSESTYSMDVLSGGESDAGDTLSRQNNNNNSISSCLTNTLRDGTMEGPKRRGADLTYFIAKELLMTERTYKRDLELVTVTWSRHVSNLASSEDGCEAAQALARACLALEPLALACGAFLAKLERTLQASHMGSPPNPQTTNIDDNEEPEYKKIPELLYDYLSSTFDAYVRYIERAGTVVGLIESVRRCNAATRAECAAFEAASPLPLAGLQLRPLHRLPHYRARAAELWNATGSEPAKQALELASRAAQAAEEQLQHVENHAALCQLQRDIIGYDKLLVADREFIRLGCVYKHSTRGLQQRMLFLLSDVLVVTSRAGGSQFRAHSALPLHALSIEPADLPHSFLLQGDDIHLLISTSNEQEFLGWMHALDDAIAQAKENPVPVDTELTPYDLEIEPACGSVVSGAAGGGLAHVCWHRATSLDRPRMHLALRTQLSGYLLRKFKKSPGWQKLWVVFAVCSLFFYKSWQDEAPLASLPLLGYRVAAPEPADGIDKDFVFKLQFKNHVYFFRADSLYTYNRWVEVLGTSMVRFDHN